MWHQNPYRRWKWKTRSKQVIRRNKKNQIQARNGQNPPCFSNGHSCLIISIKQRHFIWKMMRFPALKHFSVICNLYWGRCKYIYIFSMLKKDVEPQTILLPLPRMFLGGFGVLQVQIGCPHIKYCKLYWFIIFKRLPHRGAGTLCN